MGSSEPDPRIGLVLNGRYRVTERLGEGGMGIVYRGERLELARPVAIKFLHSPYAHAPKFTARFSREAKAMSRLSHPCCVSVIDFGVQQDPYIVMDFVTGETLRHVLDRQHFTPSRAIAVVRQILSGLAHAHGQGIVHRDIKPGNIMLGEAVGIGEHVRIFDFGLAKLHDPEVKGDPSMVGIVGTPAYMAPEQARAERVDARADLYATGVVLFELLTGSKPFEGEDSYAVIRMQRESVPPRLRALAPDASLELEYVVSKALEKDPALRFQTAEEFLDALDKVPEAAGRGSTPEARTHDTVAYARTQQVESVQPESTSEISSTTGPSRAEQQAEHARKRRVVVAAIWLGAVLMSGVAWAYRAREQRAEPAGARDGVEAEPEVSASPSGTASPPEVAANAPAQDPEAMLALLNSEAGLAAEELNEGARAAADEAVEEEGAGRSDAGPVVDEPADELSEAALAAADEALNQESESEVTVPEVSGNAALSVADIQTLIAQKRIDAAISGIRQLRRKNPRNAALPYMLGELYFERGWWSDGLAKYREAIRMRSQLRERSSVQRNAIRALAGDKTYARARALLVKDIGRSAVSRLRHAARSDPSQDVRRRAKSVLRQITR